MTSHCRLKLDLSVIYITVSLFRHDRTHRKTRGSIYSQCRRYSHGLRPPDIIEHRVLVFAQKCLLVKLFGEKIGSLHWLRASQTKCSYYLSYNVAPCLPNNGHISFKWYVPSYVLVTVSFQPTLKWMFRIKRDCSNSMNDEVIQHILSYRNSIRVFTCC